MMNIAPNCLRGIYGSLWPARIEERFRFDIRVAPLGGIAQYVGA